MSIQPETIIQKLEADNSRLAKEEILREAILDTNPIFFLGLQWTLDKLHTFGVKQVPIKEEDAGQGLSWKAFAELADQLLKRKLTGNAARDAIQLQMNTATKTQWNDWYRRILIKDLRCGVSEKTVNKVVKKAGYPQYAVPVFECQLAHDGAKHPNKINGEKIIQHKLDGCLSEDWVVEFENGNKIKIKEVVDNQLKGKIKSYNTITGKIEFNTILNWAVDGVDKTEKDYKWFELTLEDGTILPPLTGNHLIYLPKLKCYRRADLLIEGDDILLDI